MLRQKPDERSFHREKGCSVLNISEKRVFFILRDKYLQTIPGQVCLHFVTRSCHARGKSSDMIKSESILNSIIVFISS